MFGACNCSIFNPAPGNCRQHGVNKTELHWVKQRIEYPLHTNSKSEMILQDQSKNYIGRKKLHAAQAWLALEQPCRCHNNFKTPTPGTAARHTPALWKQYGANKFPRAYANKIVIDPRYRFVFSSLKTDARGDVVDVKSMAEITTTRPILGNTPHKEVDVQPSGAGQIPFLLIVADWHGADQSYKINDVIAVLENNTCPASGKVLAVNQNGK